MIWRVLPGVCFGFICVLLAGCGGSDSATDEQTASDCKREGMTRCADAKIQRCTDAFWVDYTDCAIQNQQCGMNGGIAMCYRSVTSDSDSTSLVVWDTAGAPTTDTASDGTVAESSDGGGDTLKGTDSNSAVISGSDDQKDTSLPPDTSVTDSGSSQIPGDTDADSDGRMDTSVDTSSQQITVDTDTRTDGVDDTATVPAGGVGERTALFDIMNGGYVYAGDWHGYAWTTTGDVAGSTISPADYAAVVTTDTQLCISGELADDWDAIGILGINLNQNVEGDAEMPWTPGSQHTGVYLDITNSGHSEVRLQVEDADGNQYCTTVSSAGDSIKWSELKKECWDSGGAKYNGASPLVHAMLLIPGEQHDNVSYAVCLKQIYPTGSEWPEVQDTDTHVDTETVEDSDTTVDTTPKVDVVCGDDFNIYPGGYLCAGDWKGYAWTSTGEVAGATISPANFSAYTGDETSLCVEGKLALDFDSVGMLGFSLNQPSTADDTPSWIQTGSFDGVYVNVNVIDFAPMRLYIKTASDEDYCAMLTDNGDTIPWHDFRKDCWEYGGERYNGTDPLKSAMVIVPGQQNTKVSFSLCLIDIYPVDIQYTCLNDQFMCDNGNCILDEYYCDGFPDCLDGEDEFCSLSMQP